MSTSVQVLENIYGVLLKIESNTNTSVSTANKEKDATSSLGTTGNILNMLNTKEAAEKLPIITDNIEKLTKLEDTGKITNTAKSINMLSESFIAIGKVSNDANKVNDVLNGMGNGLLKFSLAILSVGGTLMLAGMLFGGGSATDGLLMVGAGILALTVLTAGIGILGGPIKKGIDVMNSIGLGFIGFSLAVLAYAGTMSLMANYLDTDDLMSTSMAVIGSMLPFALSMVLIGAFTPDIESGNTAILQVGASMILFAGSIWLAAKGLDALKDLTASKTLTEAVDVFKDIIWTFTGSFVAIGLISPLLFTGSAAIATISTSFLIFTGGMLLSATALSLMTEKLGTSNVLKAFTMIGGTLGILVGSFALLGAMTLPTLAGAATIFVISAALGLFAMSMGYMAKQFGGLLNEVDNDPLVKNPALSAFALIGGTLGMAVLSIGATALGLSVLAPMAPIIATGAAVSLLSTAALLANVASIKYAMESFKTLDMPSLLSNIEMMIGGVTFGFLNGLKKGFGIDNWMGVSELCTGEFSMKKLGNFVAGPLKSLGNLALIFTGSILLLEMSMSLAMFAKAVSAFGKPGQIGELKLDKDGNPVTTGNYVNVIDNAKNIATSVGDFFKIITSVFSDPNAIPSEEKMKTITHILLGRQSKSFVGWVTGKREPSILDALSSFGELIKSFAGKPGELALYDENGKQKSEGANIQSIVQNITTAISLFFEGLSKGVLTFTSDENLKKTAKISEVLMGSDITRKYGWGLWSTNEKKPGVIEPLIKFAEVIKLFASGKTVGENGEVEELTFDASGIVNKIITFSSELVEALSGDKAQDDLNKLATDMQSSPLEKFNALVDGLHNNVEKIDIVAESMGRLADNTGKLSDALSNLSSNQLSALFNLGGVKLPTVKQQKQSDDTTQTNGKTSVVHSNNVMQDDMVKAFTMALKSSSMVFKFQGGPTQGILTFK